MSIAAKTAPEDSIGARNLAATAKRRIIGGINKDPESGQGGASRDIEFSLFFGISRLNPIRDLPAVPGYLIDFGIWALVFFTIYWFLGVLTVGTLSRKNGPIKT